MKRVPQLDSLDIPSEAMVEERTAFYQYNIGYRAGWAAGQAEALARGSSSREDGVCDAYNIQVSAKLIESMRGCRCLECKAMVQLVAATEGK